MDENKQTLVEHLNELRGRILKCILSLAVCTVIVYTFIDKLMGFLTKPVGKLVFIAPQEAFIANIKAAFFGGLLLGSPIIIYQIWKFVSDGLLSNEKKYTLIYGPVSFVFFIIGICFGYFIIVPIGVNFLLGFATNVLVPMITISNYLSFVTTLSIAFGAIFETPIIILFLTKLGVVTPAFLLKKRKHAIVIIFILSAIITPPDVITQVLMAIPLILLYELGIIFAKVASKKMNRV